jgi:hypothetical protein
MSLFPCFSFLPLSVISLYIFLSPILLGGAGIAQSV